MTAQGAPVVSAWDDAVLAASLFAVDPAGLGGVALRARPGPVRDAWLAHLRSVLPPSAPVRRLPVHASADRILGGLDLAATLKAGRPVAERGLLAEADGGVVVMAMAERLAAASVAHFLAALDSGERVLERDGIAMRCPARFGVVALDEGLEEEERPASGLLDRLALHLDLDGIGIGEVVGATPSRDQIAAARARLPAVQAADDGLRALCAAAMALGIPSGRAPLLAARVARVVAALDGRTAVSNDDAALAARLVLVPRARTLPAAPEDLEPAGEENRARDDDTGEHDDAKVDGPLDDIVLDAAAAVLPGGLLAQLRLAGVARRQSSDGGKAGALQAAVRRGRPVGVRRGALRGGARLNVIETLRAAAPWQALRRGEIGGKRTAVDRPPRIDIRTEDFRVTRFKQRSGTMTVFVVDASGSTALHRLSEAKGAVELLLADCYTRRDEVALIAFRGVGAEILLPPTRSLVRAKRCLARLPGGGGTPLAAGIAAAAGLADTARRKGQSAAIVFLTDGRANVDRNGEAGRDAAAADAVAAARQLRASGCTALLVDTSPRARAEARRIAGEMGAVYLPLPHADAMTVSRAVQASVAPH